MVLKQKINFIRKISLLLFTFSLLSLLGSLWLQNILAEFKFHKYLYDEKVNISKTYKQSLNCSENIDICLDREDLGGLKSSKILGNCFENKFNSFFYVDNKYIGDHHKYLFIDNEIKVNNKLKPEFVNKIIHLSYEFTNEKNDKCIKNYKYYKLYQIFPYYFEFLYDLKEISSLGSQVSINPFIYGETSISNIVKRFPINLVFKPLLFISVIFMFLYWKNYNFLFNQILKSKNEKFVFFGIASAVFLFFHVLFLGMEIDNKIFKLLRKLVIVFFILSEIIAQTLLSIRLFNNKKELSYYCNIYIINIKLLFVIIIFSISLIVIFILLIYDLSNKVDYILEWNYFAGLLFYYLLSALMWKKLTNNPAST